MSRLFSAESSWCVLDMPSGPSHTFQPILKVTEYARQGNPQPPQALSPKGPREEEMPWMLVALPVQ